MLLPLCKLRLSNRDYEAKREGLDESHSVTDMIEGHVLPVVEVNPKLFTSFEVVQETLVGNLSF